MVDIAPERVRVEIFDVIIVGDFFELALTAFDGVVDMTENESNSDDDSGDANHGHEAGFAPGNRGAGLAGFGAGVCADEI